MKKNVSTRLSTDTSYIKNLVTDIKKGEIKVPKFQRPFVWKAEQAISLLDSIANNYPIASLLLWKTTNKLKAERNIGDFKLPETDDLTPTTYVLDGQQRLTVIYSCLGAPIDDEGFRAGFNLRSEEFEEIHNEESPHIFPLRLVFETSKLLDFRTALNALRDKDELQERLDSLIDIISNYKIPVVTLKDLSVEEVCPIFERINSSGTRLSTYDLMVAATWSSEFDLNDEVEKISDSLDSKNYSSIDGNTIIKCMAGILHESITKETVLNIRNLPQEQVTELASKTGTSLLKAVDTLSTEFLVYSLDFLPYEALLIILTTIYSRTNTLDQKQTNRVRQWFWRSAFSERYRGASEAFISGDIKTVSKFVLNDKGKSEEFGSVPSNEQVQRLVFRSNNSRSRAFVLMLAKKKPRNLTNGAHVDTSEALSLFNKKQFHHIYPKGFLKKQGSRLEPNKLANICILSMSENIKISDEDPNKYFPKYLKELGKEADAVLSSNLLPIQAELNYSTAKYQEFLDKRTILIRATIESLYGGASI